jgi:lysozyme family protein
MSIETLIDNVIGREGGYSNHPSDTGGATMWGITERVARKQGYQGDMRLLPRATAVAIYRQLYAIDTGFAAVAEINAAVGEELFDTGVNMGPSVPALWFQESLNAFNAQGKLYPDIKEDGDIGPKTLTAFRAYLKARGADAEIVMLRALNSSQGERYKYLARSRPANEDFVFGWFRNRVS